jgi:hypothetical protein
MCVTSQMPEKEREKHAIAADVAADQREPASFLSLFRSHMHIDHWYTIVAWQEYHYGVCSLFT